MKKDYCLYLPISEVAVKAIQDNGPKEIFASLSIPELAAAIVLQEVNDSSLFSISTLEKRLAGFIDVGFINQVKVRRLAVDNFKPGLFRDGVSAAFDKRVFLLDDEEIKRQRYLVGEGLWDSEFKFRYQEEINPFKFYLNNHADSSGSYTREQFTIVREIFATGDHLDLQACAGAGKTHLLRTLLDHHLHDEVLFITHSGTQGNAICDRVGSAINHLTVKKFSGALLDEAGEFFGEPNVRSGNAYTVKPSVIAEWFGISKIGSFDPLTIVGLCQQAIASYCNDSEKILNISHLPGYCQALPIEQKNRLLSYAREMWGAIVQPPHKGVWMPLKGNHITKYVSLTDMALSYDKYKILLIDEAHDMPAPFFQIVDRGEQVVISVGDYMQRLRGSVAERSVSVRRREINRSVRVGGNLDRYLNKLIKSHPDKRGYEFLGAAKKTNIIYLKEGDIPSRPVTVICENFWGVFEWVQRLSFAGLDYRLINRDAWRVRNFVQDCVRLYKFGEKARHSFELSRYSSWQELEEEQVKLGNESFKNIVTMFKKGYSLADFDKALQRQCNDATAKTYEVGTVFDARNREFDAVMLTVDFLNMLTDQRAGRSTELYLSGTRALHELYVPTALRDYFEGEAG